MYDDHFWDGLKEILRQRRGTVVDGYLLRAGSSTSRKSSSLRRFLWQTRKRRIRIREMNRIREKPWALEPTPEGASKLRKPNPVRPPARVAASRVPGNASQIRAATPRVRNGIGMKTSETNHPPSGDRIRLRASNQGSQQLWHGVSFRNSTVLLYFACPFADFPARSRPQPILAPEEPNVYSHRCVGAPALQRSAMFPAMNASVGEVSLPWSEEDLLEPVRSINISSLRTRKLVKNAVKRQEARLLRRLKKTNRQSVIAGFRSFRCCLESV